MSSFSRWQTDVLFLLVGTNPLPNYVAAQLLAKEGGLVVLLHSKSTGEIAQDLAGRIRDSRPGLRMNFREIHHANAEVIAARMRVMLSELELGPGKLGLHYTGGTKPMAVHAYHYLKGSHPDGCFSYLDATTLQMYIEAHGARIQEIPTAGAVEIGLEDLFALHGYYLQDSPLRREPRVPELCRAILQVHRSEAGCRQWDEWVRSLGQDEPPLPDPARYPALGPAIEAFAELAAGRVPAEDAVAQALGYEELKSGSKFFCGGWLEEYTLQAVTEIAAQMRVHDWGAGARPLLKADKKRKKEDRRRDFDLDVVAMVGYQLFAISCISTATASNAKEHLLEAFVRARQVGGDEARVAVVCRVKNAPLLEREIEREEEETLGKVRVFGEQQLLGLAGQLRAWIQTANREGA